MLPPATRVGLVEWSTVQVLTFDFHNTIANCDPWFELEVRTLPWEVLQRLKVSTPLARNSEVESAYRAIRESVMASGKEVDAYNGVALVFARLGIDVPDDDVANTVDRLMADCLAHVEPVPGTLDTIRTLRDSGLPLGIVSSAVHHKTLIWVLEALGITDCFDTVVTSASCGHYKSSTGIYHTALGELGATAAISVHVGDSLRWDVQTARDAGMATAWLRTSRKDRFAASAAGQGVAPDLVLDTMVGADGPLLELLASMRRGIS